jgi:RNA polymerase sigma-70 factor (ECF subfamily)
MPNPIVEEFLAVYANLKRWLLRQTGNADDAADLAQESFVRWLDFARADNGSVQNPRAFLFQVARNLMQDRWRADQHRTSLAQEVHRARLTSTVISAECMVESRQRLAILVEAVEELPPKCKEAFKLHKFQGLSHEEVALRMGISRNMVEKHIIKALLRIRSRIKTAESS